LDIDYLLSGFFLSRFAFDDSSNSYDPSLGLYEVVLAVNFTATLLTNSRQVTNYSLVVNFATSELPLSTVGRYPEKVILSPVLSSSPDLNPSTRSLPPNSWNLWIQYRRIIDAT
jgi:hypothetical protein